MIYVCVYRFMYILVVSASIQSYQHTILIIVCVFVNMFVESETELCLGTTYVKGSFRVIPEFREGLR